MNPYDITAVGPGQLLVVAEGPQGPVTGVVVVARTTPTRVVCIDGSVWGRETRAPIPKAQGPHRRVRRATPRDTNTAAWDAAFAGLPPDIQRLDFVHSATAAELRALAKLIDRPREPLTALAMWRVDASSNHTTLRRRSADYEVGIYHYSGLLTLRRGRQHTATGHTPVGDNTAMREAAAIWAETVIAAAHGGQLND